MERYDSYKDSGVEWIGEIPKNWNVNRVGNVFTQRNETVSDKDFSALSVTKRGIVPQLDNVAKTSHNDNRKLVLKGDFVINSRSDRKGSSGTSEFDGSVSVINMILTPRGIHGKYSHYLFRSYEFIEEFFRFGKGIVWDLWSTRFSEMKGITIPIPPLHEQEQIVEYLDRKTTLIDSLIEKTVRKIELLKEKRTSLINEVVTKGLNPDVEMKDSGVEWIGEIPSHWALSRLSFLMKNGGFRSGPFGSALITSELLDYGHVRVLSPEFVTHGEEKHPLYLPESREAEMGKYRVSVGDILIPIVGTVGKARIVKLDDPTGILNQRLCRITPNPEKVTLDYIHGLLTQSNLIAIQYSLEKKGAILDHITKEILFRFRLPLPPLHEQEQIVEYLDQQTSIIDSTITTEEKRIELLKEYRQSLISEVVTGKVKVTRDE